MSHARCKHYIIGRYDAEDQWTDYSVKDDDDLERLKPVMKEAVERTLK